MTSRGIAVGLKKGHIVTPIAKTINKRDARKRSNRGKLVQEVIREVVGYAPYEKRVMELLRINADKRALRVAKRRLGSHQRGKKKREELANVIRQEAVLRAKAEAEKQKEKDKEKEKEKEKKESK
uniref:60S ribosomal protein L36 n=1 Tax=Arcella intermedia TaxID=1963864 RepID=A0A6B2LR10_9EUKA